MANSSALFLRVKSAPSLRRATAVSPGGLVSSCFMLWMTVEVSTYHGLLQWHDEEECNPRCR